IQDVGCRIDRLGPWLPRSGEHGRDAGSHRIGRTVFATDDASLTHPNAGDIGDRVVGPRLSGADPDPQISGTGPGHGPLRYLLIMGILGLGISFRRAPVDLLG